MCPLHAPSSYILPPLLTNRDTLCVEVGANCVTTLNSRMSPGELTQTGMLQRNESQLYCGSFLCALILKQSISLDIFLLIGIFQIFFGISKQAKRLFEGWGNEAFVFVISIAAITEKISSISREQNKQHKITFLGLKTDF